LTDIKRKLLSSIIDGDTAYKHWIREEIEKGEMKPGKNNKTPIIDADEKLRKKSTKSKPKNKRKKDCGCK